ncbi:hypothetical protein XENTR_v10006455 [Xenopus tropicalis]|nr:hypothetical protein XENTR_v10006455 [Xenopus tropicalis]
MALVVVHLYVGTLQLSCHFACYRWTVGAAEISLAHVWDDVGHLCNYLYAQTLSLYGKYYQQRRTATDMALNGFRYIMCSGNLYRIFRALAGIPCYSGKGS